MIALVLIFLIVLGIIIFKLTAHVARLERKLEQLQQAMVLQGRLIERRVAEKAEKPSQDTSVPPVQISPPPGVQPPPITAPGYLPPKAEVWPPEAAATNVPHIVLPPVIEQITVPPPPEMNIAEPVLDPTPVQSAVAAFAEEQRQDIPDALPSNVHPVRNRIDWELLIGGNVFTFLGAAVIVIAVALLLTLAFDKGWINPSPLMRVLGGILLGAAFLAAGARMQARDLSVFAQGLVGAGIAILYLAVYAAYAYYHLPFMTPLWLMVGMLLVTSIAFWQSVLYNSQAIALLGLLGGVLAPIILGSGEAEQAAQSPLGYYLYVTCLILELLAMQFVRRQWQILAVAAVAAAYLLFLLPEASRQVENSLPLVFLGVYWLLFLAMDVHQGWLATDDGDTSRTVRYFLNHIIFGLLLYVVLFRWHHEWLGHAYMLAALPPLLLAGFAWRVLSVNSRSVGHHLLVVSGSISMALSFYFSGYPLIIAWSSFAALLLWLGVSARMPVLWRAALLLFSVTGLWLLLLPGTFSTDDLKNYLPIVNLRSLAMLSLIAGLAVSSWRLTFEDEESDALWITPVLNYLWMLLLAVLLAVEVFDAFRAFNGSVAAPFTGARYMILAVIWTFYSLPLLWHGLRMASSAHQYVGVLTMASGVLVAAVIGAHYQPIDDFLLLLNLRAVPMLLIAGALLLQARLFAREGDRYTFTAALSGVMQVLAAILFFELITVETLDAFFNAQLHAVSVFGFVRTSSLPAIWALYAVVLGGYAAWRRYLPLLCCTMIVQGLAAMAMAIAAIQEMPVANAALLLPMRILPMLVVCAGMGLLYRLMWAFQHQYRWMPALRSLLLILLAALGFLALTVECNDHFYRLFVAGVFGESPASMGYARYLALAAIWALYACGWSWYGLHRADTVLTVTGLTMLFLAIAWAVVRSLWEYPLPLFTLLFNWRGLSLLLVIASVIAHARLFWIYRGQQHVYRQLTGILRVVSVLLILELLTVETLDYFANRIMLAGYSTPEAARLLDLRRTIISVVWLLYSSALIIYGIWRALRSMRVIAIALFLLSIFQIALYYLMVPNLLYRIISLAGLGLTLLFTSYLYHRYRDVILSPGISDEEANAETVSEKATPAETASHPLE